MTPAAAGVWYIEFWEMGLSDYDGEEPCDDLDTVSEEGTK